MGKRKNEVECCAIFVKKDFENKEQVIKFCELAKKYNCVGIHPSLTLEMIVMFLIEDIEEAKKCKKELEQQFYDCRLVEKGIYVDKKYVEKDELFQLLCDTLNHYGDYFKVGMSPIGIVEMSCDLGGKIVHCAYSKDNLLICGLENGKMFSTHKPKRDGRQIVVDLEREIIVWRECHIGCRKKLENE